MSKSKILTVDPQNLHMFPGSHFYAAVLQVVYLK